MEHLRGPHIVIDAFFLVFAGAVPQFGDVISDPFTMENVQNRAAEDANCWYPDYYCAFTPENIIPGYGVHGVPDVTSAYDCYSQCKDLASCHHFTWIKFRRQTRCYFLKQCDNPATTEPNKNYRIYDDHCLFADPRKCISGPRDCAALDNNAYCPRPNPLPGAGYVQWQCEDSMEGNKIRFYDNTVNLKAGTRCVQTCAAWQSERRKDEDTPRAFIFSECLADGSWTQVSPHDHLDGVDQMFWPKLSDLGPNYHAYPKPDAVLSDSNPPLKCECNEHILKWPPSQAMADASGTSMDNQYFYNPRAEFGTDFECRYEVYNEYVDALGKFVIIGKNVCRLLCDQVLVATVQCVDGKWKGGVELGMWCYSYPERATAMNWRRTVGYWK